MRVRKKHGLPFWMHRYRHRKGIPLGLLTYVLILALLSSRIWAVEVVGNVATPTEDILAVAQDMGVRLGARMDGLRIKQLEIMGLNRLPTLAWISVNPSGCVARVEVVERRPTPQVLDLTQPSDMVALRDGRIVSMTVVSGQACVKVGEAVSAGTVLIRGCTGDESEQTPCRAYGEVWAQTERRITVTIPLTYYPAEADGFTSVCPTLHILGVQIPLYVTPPTGAEYHVTERSHFLQANGLTLPLGVTNGYYVRVKRTATRRTAEEAARLAKTQLAQQAASLFVDAQVTELERTQKVVGDNYVLSVKYQCLENIAAEEPY